MKLRVAINGYGRIGRHVLRAFLERGGGDYLEWVAINDLGEAETLAHLTQFDSTHGRLNADVVLNDKYLQIKSRENGPQFAPISMLVLQEADPAKLPWAELNIDLVLECTGHFRSYEDAKKHVYAGARRVIIGAAPFDDVDATVVFGVNHESISSMHRVLSSVSCTTHALVPLVKILDDAFGLESGLMTEIHAMTSDQAVLDHTHRDIRRGRAAGVNMIPTTSSSIAALRKVLPGVGERVDGYSLRVPTQNVAAVDFSFVAKKTISTQMINQLFLEKSQTDFQTILAYNDAPLVSSDFNHQPYSLVFDATQTRVVGQQAKVMVWYDNEWGYANRLLDLCQYLSKR
jgi:glyceraldehyde 3-phosphate dehydrogenase